MIRDHGRAGGPKGLVSVAGVKFTTARLVAERALATLMPYLRPRTARNEAGRPPLATGIDFDRADMDALGAEAAGVLRRVVRDEAVMTIDDLIFRRTNWAIAENDLSALRRRVSEAVGWSGEAREPVRLNNMEPGAAARASA
jgi:glycerol-3-phosphate dehydrogenase